MKRNGKVASWSMQKKSGRVTDNKWWNNDFTRGNPGGLRSLGSFLHEDGF